MKCDFYVSATWKQGTRIEAMLLHSAENGIGRGARTPLGTIELMLDAGKHIGVLIWSYDKITWLNIGLMRKLERGKLEIDTNAKGYRLHSLPDMYILENTAIPLVKPLLTRRRTKK